MASPRARLRAGQILTNDDGRRYRIIEYLAGGGYGSVYRAATLSTTSDRNVRTVCVKVCASATDWHGEAHFGHLLAGYPEVVEVIDSFAVGTEPRRRTRYVLVLEYLADGTIAQLADDPEWHGWSPGRVHREIRRLLRVLALMHTSGVTHRDIKPDNVFVRDGHLVLGDFGISKHTLTPKRSPIDAYTPAYSPTDIEERQNWATWVDIYQVGLLAGTLLTGQDWQSGDVAHIRTLEAPDDLKCWIWHATARNGLRYVNGSQAATALKELGSVDMRYKTGPRSLYGHHVALTGRFSIGTQRELSKAIAKAGGVVQSSITDDTTVLVRAPQIANTVGIAEGSKLYEVRERKRRGERIHVISEDRLQKLLL
ncbi:protein kinase [Gordonia sp. LSe1-13]|uniref:non-specific serine/threonine protein kinase n=1 Tax=Gordonia sesuvii TaxID=3116777 RepID=A0ABU7MFD0_9ACTN|nr:protein kinase [Gordonia sp. LSe1-13]